MKIDIPTILKDFQGTKDQFQKMLDDLSAGIAPYDQFGSAEDQYKLYSSVNKSICFIHPSTNPNDYGEWIYANGIYYHLTSTSTGGGNIYNIDIDHQPDSGEITNILREKDPSYNPEDGQICVTHITEDDTYITYIYSNGLWVPQTTNAQYVVFPNGIRRNQAWGWKEATDGQIVTECVGYNLKDLLEYYLIQQKWPTLTASWSNTTYSAPTLTLDEQIDESTPIINALNGELYEVGSSLTAYAINFSKSYTINGDSNTFGPAKITGAIYGTENSSAADYVGDTITAHYDYDINQDTSVVIRNIEGFTDAPIEEEAITDRQLTVGENLNTINVKYINNTTITTQAMDVDIPGIPDARYKNNAGEVDDSHKFSLITPNVTESLRISIPSFTSEPQPTTEKTVTIKGVYRFYTNGTTAPNAIKEWTGDLQHYAKWNSELVAEGNVNDGYKPCDSLYNYIDHDAIVYVGFGSYISASTGEEYYRYIYIPSHLDIEGIGRWNSIQKLIDWDASANLVGTVQINNITYNKWHIVYPPKGGNVYAIKIKKL